MSYFDEYGMPNPSVGERSTNGILFLVELIFLLKLKHGTFNRQHLDNFNRAVISMMEKDGSFAQTPWTTVDVDRASHDNVTAIASLSYATNGLYHQIFDMKHYLHPRDFIYYGLLRKRWWAKLLLPIHSILMIHTCWRYYEAPNGLPDTDGKLLAWVKFQAYPMPRTEWICNQFIDNHFGGWKEVFQIYFRNLSNPVRIAAEAIL